jgi:CheY-like chemotaxis protein
VPAPTRARLLVIDDDPNVRTFVCELLRTLGYEADAAPDGPTGLARLGARHYDLVITDLRMPYMSGWEVLQRVRQDMPSMPVIIISGFATDEDIGRAQELGVALLPKPFSLADLRRALGQALPPGAPPRKPLAKADEGPTGESAPGDARGAT